MLASDESRLRTMLRGRGQYFGLVAETEAEENILFTLLLLLHGADT